MKLSESKLTEQQAREERQKVHLAHIDDAFADVRLVMHAAEGSVPPPEHQAHVWSSQNAVHAAIFLDIAQMFAEKAAKE